MLPDLFKHNRTVAICGYAGMGKSELAQKSVQIYTGIHTSSYFNAIWINTEESAEVKDMFYNIASYLCIPTVEVHSKEKVSFKIIQHAV